MSVAIREMTADDMESVVAIIASHVREDGVLARRYYDVLFQQPPATRERERSFVSVDSCGTVTGVCGYAPDKYGLPDILWLSWFYVAKSRMGTMVGFRLYQYALAAVHGLGVRKLYLDTCNEEPYAQALRFYRSAGFTLEGKLIDYYGSGSHMLIMGLDLAAQPFNRRRSG